MTLRLASIVAMMLTVAGCGGGAMPTSPPTTPSVVSPAGRWSGSISDAISGDGTMQLALIEPTPNVLSGTWSAAFKNGDSFSGVAVSILVAPATYGVTLYVDPEPPCAGPGGTAPLGYTLVDLEVTSSRLTAVAGRISCNGFSIGTVNLSKQ